MAKTALQKPHCIAKNQEMAMVVRLLRPIATTAPARFLFGLRRPLQIIGRCLGYHPPRINFVSERAGARAAKAADLYGMGAFQAFQREAPAMDQSRFGLQTCLANRCNQARLTESAVNLATVSRIFDPIRLHTGVTKPRLDRCRCLLQSEKKRRRQNLHPSASQPGRPIGHSP